VGPRRIQRGSIPSAVIDSSLAGPLEETITLHPAKRLIEGYGGSDLSPALRYLAEDQHVRAVVVITDGEIAYPPEAMPNELLWLVPASFPSAFDPPYGRVVAMEPV
jgi:hypothetical protein